MWYNRRITTPNDKLVDFMIELTCRISTADNSVDLLAIINDMTYEPTNDHGADDMSVSAEDKFYEDPKLYYDNTVLMRQTPIASQINISVPTMPQHKPN